MMQQTVSPDLETIRRVAKCKGVDSWGFVWRRNEVPFTEQDIPEVNLCLSWIKDNTIPRKRINYTCTSYYLKHVVERHYNRYIGNGCFIVAALISGYRVVIVNTINASFDMSFKKGCLR